MSLVHALVLAALHGGGSAQYGAGTEEERRGAAANTSTSRLSPSRQLLPSTRRRMPRHLFFPRSTPLTFAPLTAHARRWSGTPPVSPAARPASGRRRRVRARPPAP